MPNIGDIGGTFFTEAYSPSNWSLPSHVSLFTGIPATAHDIHGENKSLKPGHSIWEWLQDEGYRTGLFTRNNFVSSDEWGLNRGFDRIVSDFEAWNPPFSNGTSPTGIDSKRDFVGESLKAGHPIKSIFNGIAFKLRGSGYLPGFLRSPPANIANQVVTNCYEWIGSTSEPWGACINIFDTHHPYTPVPEHNHWGRHPHSIYAPDDKYNVTWDIVSGRRSWDEVTVLEDLYDGTIRQADAAVGCLLDKLRKDNILSDTLVIVTSDHGECFGEQCGLRDIRHIEHTGGLSDELLHVPLVIKKPDQTRSERVNDLVSLHDLSNVIRETARGGENATDQLRTRSRVVCSADHSKRWDSDSLPNNVEINDKIRSYIDNLSGLGIAVYDSDEDVKYIWWGEDSATVDRDTDEIVNTDPPISKPNSPNKNISSDVESIDGQTKATLEDLGYM